VQKDGAFEEILYLKHPTMRGNNNTLSALAKLKNKNTGLGSKLENLCVAGFGYPTN
jgi:hypothetical protein